MDELTYLRHVSHICLILMRLCEDRSFLLRHYRPYSEVSVEDGDRIQYVCDNISEFKFRKKDLLGSIGIAKGSMDCLEMSETPIGRDGTCMYSPEEIGMFNDTVYPAGLRLAEQIDDPLRVVALLRPFDYNVRQGEFNKVTDKYAWIDKLSLNELILVATGIESIAAFMNAPTTISDSSHLWIKSETTGYLQVIRPDPRDAVPPGIMCDSAIRTYCGLNGDLPEGVKPLVENVQSSLTCEGVLSYGVSSYGFDARLGTEFVVFKKKPKSKKWFQFWKKDTNIVDPKDIRRIGIRRFKSIAPVVIPPHGFLLAHTKEVFNMPEDVIADVVGKSTYARCSLIVNVTPIEPGWYGQVTLEISNTSDFPAIVYPGEGVCQFRFFKGAQKCETPYNARNGKYLNQTGVVLPRVMPDKKIIFEISHGIPEFNSLRDFYTRTMLGSLETDLRKEYGNEVSADQIIGTLGDPRDSVTVKATPDGELAPWLQFDQSCSDITGDVSLLTKSVEDALRKTLKQFEEECPRFASLDQDTQMFMAGFRTLSNEKNLSDGIIGRKWNAMVLEPYIRIVGTPAGRMNDLRHLYSEVRRTLNK